jgi:hypothetical protein
VVKSLLGAWIFAVVAAGSSHRHFDVAASFVAPKEPGMAGAVSVLFSPTDPDVHINEEPAPRLKLDPGQIVLVDRQAAPPARAADFDPDKTRFLDVAKPVRFPVAIGTKAPKGKQEVTAKVVYFYCSKREGWCRRDSAEVEFTVDVP